jgi:TFIIF-interacting CTD phosphatase-like protein
LEPIIYTSGVPEYTNMLLDIVDPKKEIFEHRIYQNACYVFEKKDEDIFYMIKDISRFKNRDMKRSVLVDPNALNFMLAPENGLTFVPYNAEMDLETVDKDEYLFLVIEQIKELIK